MAGASSGAAIGGWILGLLGLSALVEDLIATLPRALQYYQQGIQEAWRSPSENRSCSSPAEGNHGSLSQATFLLANGHVQRVITLLSALMLWISRGRSGRANALQSINQSARLGPRFAQWIETNEEKLHTLLASRTRQGGGGAGRVAESAENAAAKAAKGKVARNKPGKEKDDGAKDKNSNSGEKGKCGEWLAKMDMIRGGFDEVVSVQNNSGHGVDLIGRNSKTGKVKVWEVKTTDGAKAPGLSEAQASLGGKDFTDDRLRRASSGAGNYGKVPAAMENAEKAQDWLKSAKKKGSLVSYKKREVFVDDLEKGCAKHPNRQSRSKEWNAK